MKLSDPTVCQICSEKWWGIVKSIYGQKILCTIPLLVEGPRTIFDAKEKAELLNEYFASQSSLDDSLAELPSGIEYFQSSRLSLSQCRVAWPGTESARSTTELKRSLDSTIFI